MLNTRIVNLLPTQRRGPNDGFITISASSHNGCGIAPMRVLAARMPDCISYAKAAEASAPTRFKTILQQLVSKDNVTSMLASSGNQSADIVEAAEAERRRAEAEKKTTCGRENCRCQGCKNEGQIRMLLPPGHCARRSWRRRRRNREEETKAAQRAHDDKHRDGSVVKNDNYHIYFKPDGKLWSKASPQKTTNSKISPGTVIMHWAKGAVKNVDGGQSLDGKHKFTFSNPKDQVVFQEGVRSEVMSLEALVKKEGVKSLYNHELPTAAVKLFVPKKQTVVFVPDPVDEQLFNKCSEAATKTASCRMLWVCAIAQGNVVPKGIALVAVKQVIAKIEGGEL